MPLLTLTTATTDIDTATLSVAFKKFVGQFRMIDDNLLLPHVLDGFICVALNWVVVLVDFNAKASTGGEVVRLGKVTKSMMLHSLKYVVNAHPLASLAQSFFSSLWPNLIKAWNNEGSSLDLKDHLQLAVEDLAGDLGLTHVEDLFTVYSPNVVHLLQSSPICRRKPLDTGNLCSK